MRSHLMNSTFRGPVYAFDTGGGPAGFRPFSKFFGRSEPRQQSGIQNNQNSEGNQNNQNNNNQNGNNQSTGNQNIETDDENKDFNFETFLADNKDLWQDDDEGNEITPEQQAARETAENKRKESLANYIKAQNFGVKVDLNKFKDAIEQNNPEYVNALFNEALQRVFAQSLHDVTRMMTASEERLRDVVTNIAQNNISARESELSLLQALPLAGNPAFKTLAMAAKSRFMKKGQSDEEANESVVKMFKSIRKAPASLLGLDDEEDELTTPINGSRRARVTNDKKNGTKLINGEPEDWGAFLSGR